MAYPPHARQSLPRALSQAEQPQENKTQLEKATKNFLSDTAGFVKRVTPGVFSFPLFPGSLCTRTVQSGFVPHLTFLVQKLLGEMEKSGKEKTPG